LRVKDFYFDEEDLAVSGLLSRFLIALLSTFAAAYGVLVGSFLLGASGD
jgi:hypothetical protein